jgi:hypothetical protein
MHDAHHWLPAGYAVDILDPDVLILRREDGSMVAAFSARGSTSESVRRAAEDDRRSIQQFVTRSASDGDARRW